MAFVIGLSELTFTTMPFKLRVHGMPTLPIRRCHPVRGLGEEAIFVSETMAKEDINSSNGCDEVGMGDAKR